jgi:hypothetical protein
MRLDIDFEKGTLRVSVPADFKKPTSAGRVSTRLRDAYRLLELRSYTEAVVFAALAVEDSIPKEAKVDPVASLNETLRRAGVAVAIAREFAGLRNEAVHGDRGFTQKKAERALRLAESAITQLLSRSPQSRLPQT